MNEEFYQVMKLLRHIAQKGNINVSRNLADFVSDKFLQLSTEQTLLKFVDKFCAIMQASLDDYELHIDIKNGIMPALTGVNSISILAWIKEYPKIAGMLATVGKWEVQKDMCESIEIPILDKTKEKIATKAPECDINITLETMSPLAHGSDQKAGNATLFRRMDVMTDGGVATLPYYAGNPIRGEIRDLLADHFLNSLGIGRSRSKPKVELWFFHALYAGGALEENSKSGKALAEYIGKNGAVKADGIYMFRDTFPALSLLGTALGNRILCGRAKFADYRPQCKQWGSGDGDVSELFEWCFLTRREDHEGHEDGENSSMIANTECLKIGTKLTGGIDIDTHISELEKSALGLGLKLLKDKGYIGANSNRGFGRVNIDIDNIPDDTLYIEYLKNNKDKIIEFMRDIYAYSDPKLI